MAPNKGGRTEPCRGPEGPLAWVNTDAQSVVDRLKAEIIDTRRINAQARSVARERRRREGGENDEAPRRRRRRGAAEPRVIYDPEPED